jgi:hypothetical protein
MSLLPQRKYGSIIAIFHNLEDFSQMTLALGQDDPLHQRPYAFACDEKNKGKKKAPNSSSSSE